MQVKEAIAVLSAIAVSASAAPTKNGKAGDSGFPLVAPGGTGNANVSLVLGGGILPTLTLGGLLSGTDGQLAMGMSNDVGIGGGPWPTVHVGAGY
ncbi:hypothetical protein GGH92_010141, partial [Coemansia sp. RSA 2673]